MNCVSCGVDVVRGSKFCTTCGVAMAPFVGNDLPIKPKAYQNPIVIVLCSTVVAATCIVGFIYKDKVLSSFGAANGANTATQASDHSFVPPSAANQTSAASIQAANEAIALGALTSDERANLKAQADERAAVEASAKAVADAVVAAMAPVEASADAAGEGTSSALVEAMAAAAANAVAPIEAQPTPVRISPSFRCVSNMTLVEQLICSDDRLAQKDRVYAAIYVARLSGGTTATRQQQKAEGRSALKERGKCTDVACIENWYQNQISALEN